MKTKTLVSCALLAALGAIFSAFLSIEIPMGASKIIEVSLTPLCIMLAGIFFGPIAGFITGFVSDTAGFFMGIQYSAYNPIFSVTMGIFGLLGGFIFLNKQSIIKPWIKGLLLCIIAQLLCSVLLNTYAIHFFYGVPLQVLFIPRLVAALIEIPIYFILLLALYKGLAPTVGKANSKHIDVEK